MKRYFPFLVFAAGLACVAWVGAGYLRANPLALAMTLLIAAGYGAGVLELRRFQQATTALDRSLAALQAAPERLDTWLDGLPPALRQAVRLRVEGERVALPGPALAPYLTGLLVLLGMLGTFLGMVVTLNGTGAALDRATDMAAIREVLSAPVRGLGLAFGTSVAGVAASAMLGLLSALARRERLAVAQRLDALAATVLHPFTRAYRREESLRLLQRQADSLQQQAEALPRVTAQLATLMATLERQQTTLHERLLAGQDSFHARTEAAYTGLAASVGESLREGLEGSARAAGQAIGPAVETTLAALSREAAALHGRLAQTQQDHVEQLASAFEQRAQALVEGVDTRLAASGQALAAHWQGALAAHEAASARLAESTRAALAQAAQDLAAQAGAQLQALGAAQHAAAARQAEQGSQQLAAWQAALDAQGRALQDQWAQAGEGMAARQQAIVETLERTATQVSAQAGEQAARTIAEIARLAEAAAEAPRAAAEVIAELRQKLSDSMARDNAMLDERARVLGTLGTLLDAVNHASTEQRAAIDALLAASADVLERVGARFADTADREAARLAGAADQATASVVEVASLGDAFGHAVALFGQSSEQLGAQLGRIEAALSQSMARSDEQLAYYVAQAREVVDLSLLSQKQIVEELQQLGRAGRTEGASA